MIAAIDAKSVAGLASKRAEIQHPICRIQKGVNSTGLNPGVAGHGAGVVDCVAVGIHGDRECRPESGDMPPAPILVEQDRTAVSTRDVTRPQNSLSGNRTNVVVQAFTMPHYHVTIHVKRPDAKSRAERHEFVVKVEIDQLLKDQVSVDPLGQELSQRNHESMVLECLERVSCECLNAEMAGTVRADDLVSTNARLVDVGQGFPNLTPNMSLPGVELWRLESKAPSS